MACSDRPRGAESSSDHRPRWSLRTEGLRTLALVAVVLSLLGTATGASAHAFLDRAEPRVGSRVKTPPREVRLYFTQRLEPAYSTARVTNDAGQQVDNHDVHVDPADPAVLVVSVPALVPGTYRVTWRVLSVDTHVTDGDFTFRVKP